MAIPVRSVLIRLVNKLRGLLIGRTTGDGTTREADGTATGDRTSPYFEDLPDGSGCAEVWDHLSERERTSNTDD